MKKGRNWLAALVCLLVLLVPMILAGYSQQVRPGDDVQAALYDVGYEGEVVLSPGRYDANWVIPGGRTLRALTVEDRATLIFNPMGPTTNVLSVDGDDVKIMDLNLVSGACGIWTGSFNTEVERCWFLDGDAGGWVTEPGTGKFIGCRFENTNTGLTNEHAEMLEVYDNYFVGNRRSIHCMSRSTSAIQHNNFADGEMFVTIQLDTVRLTTIGSCDFAGDSVGVKVIGQPTDHISVRNCVFHDMPYNAIDIRYVRVLTGAVNKVFIINNTLKNVGNNGVWADISGVSTNNAIDYRNNLVNGTRCCLASMRPLNISG